MSLSTNTKPASEPASKCGTYAGYNQHMYYGEPTCAACRKAATDYQRDRRKANGNAAGAKYNKARGKALTKLAYLHENEYRQLIRAELADSGDVQ